MSRGAGLLSPRQSPAVLPAALAGRRPRRAVLVMLACGAVAFAGWSGHDLLSAKSHLERARAQASAVGLGAGGTRARLAEAEGELGAARRDLSTGPVRLLAHVPYAGRTVVAARTVAEVGQATAQAAAAALDSVSGPDGRLRLLHDGSVDLPALAALRGSLLSGHDRLAGPLDRLAALRLGTVPGPVRDAVEQARSQLAPVPAQLDQGAAAAAAVSGLLGADGPRRVLVALENNAELRGSGGLVSVFAVVTADHGHVSVGGFRDVEQVKDPPGRAREVAAPPDFVDLWGPLRANSTLWRNANASADLPTSSRVLANVADATLPQPVDAVLWLDVRAVAALVGLGPATTLPDGTVLSGDTTVQALLSDAYRSAGSDIEQQALRRARLRATADVVVRRLLGQQPDLFALGPAMAQAVRGRHLALWSAVPDEQRALAAAGVAGQLADGPGDLGPTDLVSMTVHNLGDGAHDGNKLDYYARRQVGVRAEVDDRSAAVAVTAELRNGVSGVPDLPPYVTGVHDPGTTNNLVLLALPRAAEQVRLSRGGVPLRVVRQPEGDHDVLVDTVRLAPRTSARWELSYVLPLTGGAYRLRVVPQPLAVDGGLDLHVRAAPGTQLDRDVDASGPFAATTDVQVRASRPHPSRWQRLRSAVTGFWTTPVSV